MDITFKALKETDIGRHVNGLRKHSSSEVRRLVKQIVRKWKDLVDEWVKLNTPGETAAATIMDSDSPLQNPGKMNQNGNQLSDSTYSPNWINGNSGGDKKSMGSVSKGKGVDQRENQAKQSLAAPVPASFQKQKESTPDLEKLVAGHFSLDCPTKSWLLAIFRGTVQRKINSCLFFIPEIPLAIKRKRGYFGHENETFRFR